MSHSDNSKAHLQRNSTNFAPMNSVSHHNNTNGGKGSF